MQSVTGHCLEKPQWCSCQNRRQEQWWAQQEMSNPGLPQDSKKLHSTSHQSKVRAPALLAGEELFNKNKAP